MLNMSVGGGTETGEVTVATTDNKGMSIEYWADRCTDRIVHVGNDPLYPSPIRDQAIAFKEQVRQTINHYIKQAVKSDRTTLYNLFVQQGHTDMAEILRRL